MKTRNAAITAILVGILNTGIAQAEQTNETENPFHNVAPAIREGLSRALNATIEDAVRILGWKDVHVPGKPLKDCLGPSNELNEEVLRCRNGYTKRVPIYSQ